MTIGYDSGYSKPELIPLSLSDFDITRETKLKFRKHLINTLNKKLNIMQRQDITFRIVVKDEELKQAYIDSYNTNYKFGDRGFDLIVPKDYKINVFSGSNKIDHEIQVAGYYVYDTGEVFTEEATLTTVSIEHEVGYDLRVRSGTGANTRLRLSNPPGTIDHYRGNVTAIFDHIPFTNEYVKEDKRLDLATGKEYIFIAKGTRLVQLVNPNGYGVLVEFVDELPPTERNKNGFGSSGGI
jgi:dUTPase